MKLFLPKQHGAWAMLLLPFWLGVIASEWMWQYIPFFIGWTLLYLGTYPLLLLFKKKKIAFHMKWTIIYMLPAILFLIVPLWTRPSIIYFGFIMLPFFILNAYFSSKNKDRAFLNDVSAIIVFAISGLASYYLSTGVVNEESVFLFVINILFFIGSTFYVKTMIREKRNSTFKWLSWSYHISVVVFMLLIGMPLASIAFLPSLARAVGLYGKPLSVKAVGILEIVNAVIFFVIVSIMLLVS